MAEKTVNLSSLSPAKGSTHRRKRRGIGQGSGLGKTAGKGQKGQNSRSGVSHGPFEGGQMPLHRRLPKVGFTSRKRVRGENIFSLVPLKKLLELEVEGEITLELLRQKGFIRSRAHRVKVLGGVEVDRALTVEAHAFSASAKEAIEKAGGSARLIESKAAAEDK